jgi:hypothetical protein
VILRIRLLIYISTHVLTELDKHAFISPDGYADGNNDIT